MHVLADTSCKFCSFEFYHTLPIGHDLLFPIQVSKDGKESFYHPKAKDWLARPLIESLNQKTEKRFPIEKEVNQDCQQVILVNCLDSCFGHIFSKVWNTYTLIESKPDWGVIAIIPDRCKWLLPKDIAEVWSVSVQLQECGELLGGLDEFVKSQCFRFERVSLSPTYTHLDHTRYIDMEKVLKTSRFDLDKFNSSLKNCYWLFQTLIILLGITHYRYLCWCVIYYWIFIFTTMQNLIWYKFIFKLFQ
jgi:hypothetical protein